MHFSFTRFPKPKLFSCDFLEKSQLSATPENASDEGEML
jgi:hypothetical protein